ncbi:MAG TPA: phosphotransferase family protein [Myxococcota bacterium]|nr:phosphotransferase family protein [Myxococcota bacterium]
MSASEAAGEVRGIDLPRVSEWFAAHVAGARAPFQFELITGGHSNLTYKVTDSAGELFVLRRPPLGAVLATAHDMGREHKIIAALGRHTLVPVAPALGLCQDVAVNGAPFYVMKFVKGHVITDATTVARLFTEPQRAEVGASLIDVLARLHCVDPDAVGLGDLGRKDAYLPRQLNRWRTQWENSKTRELPAMEEVHEALVAMMPSQKDATIVHGDYRLGNCITGDDRKIQAVLDWELCTLGDPMADIGYLMNNWAEPGETGGTAAAAASPSAAGGFQSRAEILEIYARKTGRDVTNVDYYRAFQYWRLAAIVEGVMARYLKGVMGGNADTRAFKAQIDGLAASALDLVRRLRAR